MFITKRKVRFVDLKCFDDLLRFSLFLRNKLSVSVFGIVLLLCLCVRSVTAKTTAQQLITRLEVKLRSALSITGTIRTVDEEGTAAQFDFKALKPNLYTIISKTREVYCDGNAIYDYSPQQRLYTRELLGPTSSAEFNLLEPFQPFVIAMPSFSKRVKGLHREQFDGKVCNAILMSTPDNKATRLLRPIVCFILVTPNTAVEQIVQRIGPTSCLWLDVIYSQLSC